MTECFFACSTKHELFILDVPEDFSSTFKCPMCGDVSCMPIISPYKQEGLLTEELNINGHKATMVRKSDTEFWMFVECADGTVLYVHHITRDGFPLRPNQWVVRGREYLGRINGVFYLQGVVVWQVAITPLLTKEPKP